jgi:hypothetical protein
MMVTKITATIMIENKKSMTKLGAAQPKVQI